MWRPSLRRKLGPASKIWDDQPPSAEDREGWEADAAQVQMLESKTNPIRADSTVRDEASIAMHALILRPTVFLCFDDGPREVVLFNDDL